MRRLVRVLILLTLTVVTDAARVLLNIVRASAKPGKMPSLAVGAEQ